MTPTELQTALSDLFAPWVQDLGLQVQAAPGPGVVVARLQVSDRLAREGGTLCGQAMMSAASLSDIPLYGRLRGSLERARLEQRPPWQELNRLSQELELPQIADMADVMRLDEQGAALADALRARVRELRDAHLMSEKIAAQQVSERMTLWMVVPSMVFGLVFLTPPILKLLGFAA